MEALIPDKVFFKIGEVAQITSLRPSVLRYWETEFQILKPKKVVLVNDFIQKTTLKRFMRLKIAL